MSLRTLTHLRVDWEDTRLSDKKSDICDAVVSICFIESESEFFFGKTVTNSRQTGSDAQKYQRVVEKDSGTGS